MRRDRLLLLFVILTTLIYTGFYAQFHIDPHHDGVILKPAIDVINGKRLFAETFTQYGALTTLIHVGFMKLFGATLFVQRMSAVVFYGISAAFLYMLSRKVFSSFVSVAICLMWLITAYFPNRELIVPFMAWSSVYSLTFQLIAVWFFVRYIEGKGNLKLILSGVFTACTFWARQPVGIFLFLGMDALLLARFVLAKEKRTAVKDGLFFLIGVFLGSFPFALWLLTTGAVHDWWLQSMVLAFNFGNNLSGHFSIFEIFAKLFPSVIVSKKNLFWLAAIFASWILFFLQALRFLIIKEKDNRRSWILTTFAVTSVASWMQFFPANDQSHFFWAGTLMLIPLVYCIDKGIVFFLKHGAEEYDIRKTGWIPSIHAFLSIAILFFLLGGFLVTDLKGTKWYLRSSFRTLSSPPSLVGMKVPEEEQIVLDRVESRLADYFKLYPQKTYINAGQDALYTLLDPHFASFHKAHVYWDWTVLSVFTDYFTALDAYVEQYRPLVIMRDPVALKDYCADDLSIHYPVKIQMYQRPLIVRIPIEDAVTVQKSANVVDVLSKSGDLEVVTATYSAKNNMGGTLATGSSTAIAYPKNAATVYLKVHTPFAGECQIILPVN